MILDLDQNDHGSRSKILDSDPDISPRSRLVQKSIRLLYAHSLPTSSNISYSFIFKDFAFYKLSVTYDHVTSINSVTTTVHEVRRRMSYLLMSDIT